MNDVVIQDVQFTTQRTKTDTRYDLLQSVSKIMKFDCIVSFLINIIVFVYTTVLLTAPLHDQQYIYVITCLLLCLCDFVRIIIGVCTVLCKNIHTSWVLYLIYIIMTLLTTICVIVITLVFIITFCVHNALTYYDQAILLAILSVITRVIALSIQNVMLGWKTYCWSTHRYFV